MWKRPLVIVRIIIWICITEPHAEFNLNYSHMAHEHGSWFWTWGYTLLQKHQHFDGCTWLSAPCVSSGNLSRCHENSSCFSEGISRWGINRTVSRICLHVNSMIKIQLFFLNSSPGAACDTVCPWFVANEQQATWCPVCQKHSAALHDRITRMFMLDEEWKMVKWWILCTDNNVIFRLQRAACWMPKQLTNTDRHLKSQICSW